LSAVGECTKYKADKNRVAGRMDESVGKFDEKLVRLNDTAGRVEVRVNDIDDTVGKIDDQVARVDEQLLKSDDTIAKVLEQVEITAEDSRGIRARVEDDERCVYFRWSALKLDTDSKQP